MRKRGKVIEREENNNNNNNIIQIISPDGKTNEWRTGDAKIGVARSKSQLRAQNNTRQHEETTNLHLTKTTINHFISSKYPTHTPSTVNSTSV